MRLHSTVQRSAAIATVVASSLAAPSSAHGQRPPDRSVDEGGAPPPPRASLRERAPEPRQHEGFFLRLGLGFGTLRGEQNLEGGAQLDVWEPAFATNLAIGGAVRPNWILHADLFGLWSPNPDMELTDATGDVFIDTADQLTVNGISFGVTKYFARRNLFVTGALGVGVARVETVFFDRSRRFIVREVGQTDYGVAAKLMLGKEWWVAPSLGLGIAGQFLFFSLPDGDGKFNVTSGSLLLTLSVG